MADSDLIMQCEEEDLAPWQHALENVETVIIQEENINARNDRNHMVPSPTPPDGTPTEPPATPSVHVPATGAMRSPAMPVVTPPPVAKALLPQVLQSFQVAPASTSGQPIFITSQTIPIQTAIPTQNLLNPVGYILNGQPVTLLSAAPGTQLITPKLLPAPVQPSLVIPSSFGSVPVPVSLTVSGSAGMPTISAVTSVSTAQTGLSPCRVQPSITASVPAKFTGQLTATGAQAVNPAVSLPAEHAKVSQGNTMVPSNTQSSVPTPIIKTKVFQGVSSPPKSCPRCGSQYRAVPSLRGYMCLCNPDLAQSIQALSPKPKPRPKRTSDPSRPRPSSFRPAASSRHHAGSPHLRTTEIPVGAPSPGTGDLDMQGRLIMLVDDFYYGQDPGEASNSVETSIHPNPITIKCFLCAKKLKNNIKMMNHMRHHMEMEQQRGEVDTHTSCQHCFRHFPTPFSLQCHLESVHSQVESSTKCKICEWAYENEPLFLQHMKNTHKPGEMPYVCQVCNFRSSFYQDVVSHFREMHKDTNNLLCPYCLKVFKASNSYQLHYSKHQKKSVVHCDKCRLQFLFTKDRSDHRLAHHKTHLRPKQLEGLKPGTKVTIRAYSVNKLVGDGSTTATSKNAVPSNTVDSPPAPVPQNTGRKITPTKNKPVESMVELLTKFQKQRGELVKQNCLECKYQIPDFSNHFPTLVHCSLCRYNTCCSRAYANHMITNHIPRKNTSRYLALFKPCPKSSKLSCASCDYSTEVGDLMAKHLAKHPDHYASRLKANDGFSKGYKRFVFIPTDLIREGRGLRTGMVPLQVMQVGKGMIPFSTLPLLQPKTNTSLPAGSAHGPSLPVPAQPADQSALPDESEGAGPEQQNGGGAKPGQSDGEEDALTVTQLKVVLYALCFGVPQAANHFDTAPEQVQSWLLERQVKRRPGGTGGTLAERLVEWVLSQREQQLPIDEASLFRKASEFTGKNDRQSISHSWAVDFMLSHDLGLQAVASTVRPLPRNAQENIRSFTRFLQKQVAHQGFGLSAIGAMDELTIFVDLEQLNEDTADSYSMMSAFRLTGTEAPLMDVMISVLADGTVLPAMIFLKGELPSRDVFQLPGSIILEGRQDGFSDEERLQLWLAKVWRLQVDPGSGGKGMLLMDTYRGHMDDDFLAALNSANTLPAVIPRSCSSRLQPLEACVGPVLREFLQARWSQHVAGAPENLAGAQPAKLALLLAGWLAEVLDVLVTRPELLHHSFQAVNPSSRGSSLSSTDLVRSLTEALIVTKLQEQELDQSEAEGRGTPSDIGSTHSLPSASASNQELRKIFERESDLESFHGFEESEIMDC